MFNSPPKRNVQTPALKKDMFDNSVPGDDRFQTMYQQTIGKSAAKVNRP
jgi:hypothetical protein